MRAQELRGRCGQRHSMLRLEASRGILNECEVLPDVPPSVLRLYSCDLLSDEVHCIRGHGIGRGSRRITLLEQGGFKDPLRP